MGLRRGNREVFSARIVLAKDELRSTTMELFEGSNREDEDSASNESVLVNTPQKTRDLERPITSRGHSVRRLYMSSSRKLISSCW